MTNAFVDYEQPAPWLNAIADPMDDQGYVHVSQQPGLGLDINFEYIRDHRIAE